MDLNVVSAHYTNHRGEQSLRTFLPIRLFFGSTPWHTEAQWLVEVFDLDKGATRDYAMCGFRSPWVRRDGSVPNAGSAAGYNTGREVGNAPASG